MYLIEYEGIDADGKKFQGRVRSKSAKLKNWTKKAYVERIKLPLKDFKSKATRI